MSKCQYTEVRPAATGWCKNAKPTKKCLRTVMRWCQLLEEKRGDLVVRINCMVNKEHAEEIEKKIREQAGSGVVVIPSICTAEYVPPHIGIKFSERKCRREPIRQNL